MPLFPITYVMFSILLLFLYGTTDRLTFTNLLTQFIGAFFGFFLALNTFGGEVWIDDTLATITVVRTSSGFQYEIAILSLGISIWFLFKSSWQIFSLNQQGKLRDLFKT